MALVVSFMCAVIGHVDYCKMVSWDLRGFKALLFSHQPLPCSVYRKVKKNGFECNIHINCHACDYFIYLVVISHCSEPDSL